MTGDDSDVGVLGVGELAGALLQALAAAWPGRRFHLSPRGETSSRELATRFGFERHGSNQSVANACRLLIVGVRPGQIAPLAAELRLTAAHHLLVLAAGAPLAQLRMSFAPAAVTRVMTGLAVAGGRSTISLFPRNDEAQQLFAPACATLLAFDQEAHFDASMLAICANAWWLEQLGMLTDWMCQRSGMGCAQAQALLAGNMADVAGLLALAPDRGARDLARTIGTPGTYTALGLDMLQARGAHAAWVEALEVLFQRLQPAQAVGPQG